MEFCPDCDGILLPKKGTNELICRACNKTFKMESNTKRNIRSEYRIQKKIPKKNKAKSGIVEKISKSSISDEDRKAYEDYFVSSMD